MPSTSSRSTAKSPAVALSARAQWQLLVVIFLLAATARFYVPSGFGLHDDEYLAAELIRGHGPEHFYLPQNVVVESPPNFTDFSNREPVWKIWTSLKRDAHPPLHFVVLRLFREALGPGEFALRLPSQLAGLAAVVLIFLLGRELFGPAAGLWSAALLAVSGSQIQYSQEVRNYEMLVALMLGATYALVRVQTRGPSVGRLIALGLCLLAAALTHYFAVAAIAALGIYTLAILRGPARNCVLLTFLAALLVYLALWGPWLWQQHYDFGPKNAWMLDPALGHFGRTMQRMGTVPLRCFWNPDQMPYDTSAILIYLPTLLWLLPVGLQWASRQTTLAPDASSSSPLVLRGRARVGADSRTTRHGAIQSQDPHPNPPPEYRGRGKEVWRTGVLLAFLLAALPTLMVLVLDLHRETGQLDMIRYVLVGSPGMYLLVAATCTLGTRWHRHLPAAIVALACTANFFTVDPANQKPWAYDVQEKYTFPAMVQAYEKFAVPPGATVIFVGAAGQPELSANLYLYFRYNSKIPPARVVLLSGGPASPALIAAIQSHGPAWLVTRDGHPTPAMLPGYFDDPRWQPPGQSLRPIWTTEQWRMMTGQ